MSCPDAPSAIIVNSPIAAIRTKARATRFVFKRIVPPYFRVSLVCLSQESLARPRCPVGPPWGLPRVLSRRRAALLVCEMASQKDKRRDRKSTRLNSSHSQISYAVFCLKKKYIYCPTSRASFPPAICLIYRANSSPPTRLNPSGNTSVSLGETHVCSASTFFPASVQQMR